MSEFETVFGLVQNLGQKFTDSMQVPLIGEVTFTPAAKVDRHIVFSNLSNDLPLLVCKTRLEHHFKVTSLIVHQHVSAVFFTHVTLDCEKAQTEQWAEAEDLELKFVFDGAKNSLPWCPLEENSAIDCTKFTIEKHLKNKVDWPTFPSGVNLYLGFNIKPSVFIRISAPENYIDIPRQITVKVAVTLFGQGLR